MQIKIDITDLELQTLESAIDEHKDTLGMMQDEEDIKERKKENKVLIKLLNKIKKECNHGRIK